MVKEKVRKLLKSPFCEAVVRNAWKLALDRRAADGQGVRLVSFFSPVSQLPAKGMSRAEYRPENRTRGDYRIV
jgi:hypothetical protein